MLKVESSIQDWIDFMRKRERERVLSIECVVGKTNLRLVYIFSYLGAIITKRTLSFHTNYLR